MEERWWSSSDVGPGLSRASGKVKGSQNLLTRRVLPRSRKWGQLVVPSGQSLPAAVAIPSAGLREGQGLRCGSNLQARTVVTELQKQEETKEKVTIIVKFGRRPFKFKFGSRGPLQRSWIQIMIV